MKYDDSPHWHGSTVSSKLKALKSPLAGGRGILWRTHYRTHKLSTFYWQIKLLKMRNFVKFAPFYSSGWCRNDLDLRNIRVYQNNQNRTLFDQITSRAEGSVLQFRNWSFSWPTGFLSWCRVYTLYWTKSARECGSCRVHVDRFMSIPMTLSDLERREARGQFFQVDLLNNARTARPRTTNSAG